MNQLGIDLIKSFEECKLNAYKDIVGVWTCGWGATGIDIIEGVVWTQEQADDRLVKDLARFEGYVDQMLTVELNDNQFSALVSFCYNLGPGNLTHSTLLKLVNQSDFTAASEEFKKWDLAAGKHSDGLARRRLAETILFNQKS